MGSIKHPVPHMQIKHKTNHADGWRKPVNNPTTNYGKDSHKAFCERCMAYNGLCPATETSRKSIACNL